MRLLAALSLGLVLLAALSGAPTLVTAAAAGKGSTYDPANEGIMERAARVSFSFSDLLQCTQCLACQTD